jgi:hypothetical protein
MSQSISEGLLINTSAGLPGWPRGVEDTVNIMFHTSTTGMLAIALDFAVSAADAGISRPATYVQGKGGCGRHDL